ncbi:MAG: GNAT family N-acetyltransferase [Ruminococcus sp.]
MKIVSVDKLTPEEYFEIYSSVDWIGLRFSQIAGMLERSRHTFALYEGEKLVGMARLCGEISSFVYLNDFIIKPEYQNEGYGKFLLNYIVNFIRNNKPEEKSVKLEVLSAKGKENFYKSNGFKGFEDDYSGRRLFAYV